MSRSAKSRATGLTCSTLLNVHISKVLNQQYKIMGSSSYWRRLLLGSSGKRGLVESVAMPVCWCTAV